jgi:hypothetical protein
MRESEESEVPFRQLPQWCDRMRANRDLDALAIEFSHGAGLPFPLLLFALQSDFVQEANLRERRHERRTLLGHPA